MGRARRGDGRGVAGLGAGAALEEAIALGNLASAVTIQKIGQTGTASAAEIRAAYAKRG